MLSLSPLYLMLIIGLLVWLWQSSSRAHEAAAQIAAKTCRSQDLQLLDGGAVIFQRIRLAHYQKGLFQVQRYYRFDYSSDGNSRQQGFIILTGYQLESVGLAPQSPLETNA